MEDMLSLCGLWARKDKNGVEYFTGKLTYTTRLMVFKNKRKNSEREPDYYITISKNERDNQSDNQTGSGNIIPF